MNFICLLIFDNANSNFAGFDNANSILTSSNIMPEIIDFVIIDNRLLAKIINYILKNLSWRILRF